MPILLRINILHTQKKVSLFTKKLAKKLASFKNTYYLCTRKITTNVAYSFFELIVYLYIGKIEKARNWLQPVAGGVKAKRFTCLVPKRCKFSYFI